MPGVANGAAFLAGITQQLVTHGVHFYDDGSVFGRKARGGGVGNRRAPLGHPAGSGPVIYEGPLGSLHFRIAWLPLGGTIQLLDADAHLIGYRDVQNRYWRFTWVPGAWRAPLISLAGPLTSLAVGAIFTVAYAILTPTGHSEAMLRWSALANLGGWLNLLPVGPSDGLKLLRHLAALRASA